MHLNLTFITDIYYTDEYKLQIDKRGALAIGDRARSFKEENVWI